MPDELDVVDDDFLDGCDIDFAEHAEGDEVSGLRALFPSGADDALETEWKALFADPKAGRLLAAAAPLTAAAYSYSGSGFDLGIADRLRAYGLVVVEIAGWKTRGSSSFFPKASVDHHTAGGSTGNAPSLNICINGRSDLAGPLCHVLIGRDGTCYVIAAGRANHAGTGGWGGLSGNSSVYGIERENVGTSAEPWNLEQCRVAATAHKALLAGVGRGLDKACLHKEWTDRKIDAHPSTRMANGGVDGGYWTGNRLRTYGVSVPPASGPKLKEHQVVAEIYAMYRLYLKLDQAEVESSSIERQNVSFHAWELATQRVRPDGAVVTIEFKRAEIEAYARSVSLYP